jgi:hypothetical protein
MVISNDKSIGLPIWDMSISPVTTGDSKNLDVRLSLKKLYISNLFITQGSQTRLVGRYLEGLSPNMRSSDTLRGGPMLLSGTAGVGGSYTALCSRKLNQLILNRARQSSGVGFLPDRGM